jgi:hypothetical protein
MSQTAPAQQNTSASGCAGSAFHTGREGTVSGGAQTASASRSVMKHHVVHRLPGIATDRNVAVGDHADEAVIFTSGVPDHAHTPRIEDLVE